MSASHAPSASMNALAPSRSVVPGRECGTCTLCCKTVAVKEFAKPAGVWCLHCLRAKGCAIYEARPESCRDFYCQWMLAEWLGSEWKPDRAKFALHLTPDNHVTACVDPGFPAAWRQPPYYETLKRWAKQCADDPSSAWPGIDIWIGQRCIVMLPDREADLGLVGADEAIRIDRKTTPAGPVYEAQKFKRSERGRQDFTLTARA